MAGILITFEGTEGAGKSTLIRLLAERLSPRARTTTSREPGGSPVAERIREVLLRETMDPWCELFLYEAARAEHLARTLKPALERGDLVLCDRFIHSSLAYQGEARGLPWPRIDALNRIATQGIRPALTVLVDVDPAVGLKRARDRNRFEAEGLAFQQKVRKGFLRAMRREPARWLWLKGPKTPEQNADRVEAEILRRFGRRLGKDAK